MQYYWDQKNYPQKYTQTLHIATTSFNLKQALQLLAITQINQEEKTCRCIMQHLVRPGHIRKWLKSNNNNNSSKWHAK
jgi:hypothetical protein